MPLDVFICGTCMTSFNDIEQFILHKNEQCGKAAPTETAVQIQTMENETSSAVNSVTALNQALSVEGQEDITIEVNEEQGVTSLPGSESLLADTKEIFEGENQQTVIILQGDAPDTQIVAEVIHVPQTVETLTEPVKKRRTRGPGKNKKAEKPKPDPNEKNIPIRGDDGRLICRRCKRSFTKERVFNAHKCLALSEYVDFNTKEINDMDPDDNHLPQDDLEDVGAMEMGDEDKEFKVSTSSLKKDESSDSDTFTNEDSKDADKPKEKRKRKKASDNNGKLGPVEVDANPDIEETRISRETDQISNVPVFLTEADRRAFEASLNVDISHVDEYFRVHCIEQELNPNVSHQYRNSVNQLTLYSCNVCDKVFKSLSHMRFHALIHTDLKPFKCIKCDYSSNARGNLYTHMRKHTGQFYHCKKCKFKTVNKSHLIEHEMTHAKVKRQCELCKKYYNTLKSLMSHIRKYHDNAKGKEYLAKFMQGRDLKGSTVIHQCHVCNRKFKKKMDRDRHLFIHDIKDLPNTQHCDLCDYSASRPKYLENHFQKHRCIYRCCKCMQMFLSSVRLVDHLTSMHIETSDNKSESWESLFEASINTSLYLPEPDQVIPKEEKDLINLPTELSETGLDQLNRLKNSGEEEEEDQIIDSDVFINKVPAVTETDEDNTQQIELEANEIKAEDECVETDTADKSASENKEEHSSSDLQEIDPESGVVNGDGTEDVNDNEDNGENTNEMQENLDVAETTQVAEETELTEEEYVGGRNTTVRGTELIQKLGYLPMTLQIFQKMRDTFGTEECEYCGRLFFSRVDYEPHVRTHTGERPHACLICGYRAISKDALKRHAEREHHNVQYPCKECPYIAHSRAQLWNHSMKHKGLKGVECPECQELFDSIKELKGHAALMHPNSTLEELDKLTNFKHKAQGKLGRRTYKCPYCDKTFFRTNSELQKHMWIHEGIKPFKCPLCPHSCRSKNNLQAHMIKHSKDKPFMCGDCGKAYKSKTALRWHVRSHAEGKLFKCEKCPYEATQRSHLKRHMETHDVVRRFLCQHCDFSANTIGSLKIHYSKLHKDVQSFPSIGSVPVEISQLNSSAYKCLSCDYLFGNLSDLKRHLKTRHHVNVHEINQQEPAQGRPSEIQVLQIDDGQTHPVSMEVMTSDVGNESHIITADANLDEKTASAVNILQQIFDMSQNGTLSQQVEAGSMLQINPETIIVQQEGTNMLVSANNTTEIDGNQYVIQYITPNEEENQNIGMIEVQEEISAAEVEVQPEVVNS